MAGQWCHEKGETLNCSKLSDKQVNCEINGTYTKGIPQLRVIKLDGPSIIYHNNQPISISDTSLHTNEKGNLEFDWGKGNIWIAKGNKKNL